MRNLDEILWKLEGLHTIETVAKELNLSKQSAINLLSKLKKMEHVTVIGGGKQKRIYKITMRKQRKRQPGMFDIINKYSPMKLNPWYDHQVHGEYGPEEALVDAIQTRSFRVILASLRLYSHIKDWRKLFRIAKEEDVMQEVMALYELARMYFRVRKLPYPKIRVFKRKYLVRDYVTYEEDFKPITKKWKAYIPFRKKDLDKVVI